MNLSSAAVDRYAVIGNPVEHSRSPFIHEAFALATGQRMVYGRLTAPLDGFAQTLSDSRSDPLFLGANVTVPFKEEAWRLAHSRSARCELAGAANTLIRDEQGWTADNTDGVGLIHDLIVHAGWSLQGRRILLLGAGGAARGALGPLLEQQPSALHLANRSPGKAADLLGAHRHLCLGIETRTGSWQDMDGIGYDLIINASASSLAGQAATLPASAIQAGTCVMDMMYGPACHAFLLAAQAQGAKVRDGLGMLVAQAAEAFHLWRGLRPPTEPVLHALRQQCPMLPSSSIRP